MPAPLPSPHVVDLRPISVQDLPALFEFQSDPAANSLAAVHPRERDAFMALWSSILANPSISVRAIEADGHLVGHITCFKLDGSEAVGYWIARAHWNRGIATRALPLFLRLIPTRPLFAHVASHNLASIRVLERAGFRITGRQHAPGNERYVECEEVLLELR